MANEFSDAKRSSTNDENSMASMRACCTSAMAMLIMDRDLKLPAIREPTNDVSRNNRTQFDAFVSGTNTISTLCEWSVGTDVYIHVDEPSAKVVALLNGVPNVVSVQYHKPVISRDGHYNPNSSMPRAVVQWWRLKELWKTLNELERKCSHRHLAVMRIRADLRVWFPPSTILSSLLLQLTTSASTSASIVMASDYAFAADRPTMQRIASFYDHIDAGEYYGDNSTRCHPIDYRVLIDSDWDETGPCLLKYNWLNFPRKVFDALAIKSCSAITKRMELLRNALRVAAVTNDLSTRVASYCSSCSPANRKLMNGFESEGAFLSHVLSNNIRIRKWPGHIRLGRLVNGCCCAGHHTQTLPTLSGGIGMLQ